MTQANWQCLCQLLCEMALYSKPSTSLALPVKLYQLSTAIPMLHNNHETWVPTITDHFSQVSGSAEHFQTSELSSGEFARFGAGKASVPLRKEKGASALITALCETWVSSFVLLVGWFLKRHWCLPIVIRAGRRPYRWARWKVFRGCLRGWGYAEP